MITKLRQIYGLGGKLCGWGWGALKRLFWRRPDPDRFDLLWINLKGFLLTCWITIRPTCLILKKEIFKGAKSSFTGLESFYFQIFKKGLHFLMQSINRLYKNQRLLSRFAFYAVIFSLSLVSVTIYKIYKYIYGTK